MKEKRRRLFSESPMHENVGTQTTPHGPLDRTCHAHVAVWQTSSDKVSQQILRPLAFMPCQHLELDSCCPWERALGFEHLWSSNPLRLELYRPFHMEDLDKKAATNQTSSLWSTSLDTSETTRTAVVRTQLRRHGK